jgi:hypothetical protein
MFKLGLVFADVTAQNQTPTATGKAAHLKADTPISQRSPEKYRMPEHFKRKANMAAQFSLRSG